MDFSKDTLFSSLLLGKCEYVYTCIQRMCTQINLVSTIYVYVYIEDVYSDKSRIYNITKYFIGNFHVFYKNLFQMCRCEFTQCYMLVRKRNTIIWGKGSGKRVLLIFRPSSLLSTLSLANSVPNAWERDL